MKNLTPDEVKYLVNLTPEKVVAVYSGKPGCACGCRGKYRYSSNHLMRASRHRGYNVTDDEVNDRTVARTLKLFQANVADVQCVSKGLFVYDLHENRTYTLYTVDSHK